MGKRRTNPDVVDADPPARETHIYMSKEEYADLAAAAKRDCRSVTRQVMFYVVEALRREKKKEAR